jgi:Protein of unknown function (DUF3455)
MSIFKMKTIGVSVLALAVVFGVAGSTFGQGEAQRRPELPAGCEHLDADVNERVAFRAYAEGFQVYSWNGAAWALVGPDAILYADANFRGKIGTHYGGPTWESNSGSYVKGNNPQRCTPDPDSIQWLRLEISETGGKGIFNGVSRIQRINTSGGKAPATPGVLVGEVVRVPYTTEYVFYRLAD